ncbi:MAG: IclR family transcriptional regulator [Candidatus Binatia bacterium]
MKSSEQAVLLTLQRGLRLLEAVAQEHTTARTLSERTGVKLGTCYNLLRTLGREGYVTRLPGGRYELGSRLAFLQDRLRDRLAPEPELLAIMHRLHKQVNETTYVTGWYGNDIVLQRYLESAQSLRVGGLEIGYTEHTHARASGKAILAFLPKPRQRAYFQARELAPLTRHTRTALADILADLDETAARGYALDLEEFADGICCIAAAFLDRTGFPVGSYAVSVPAIRFDVRANALATALREAATEASAHFGWTGSPIPNRMRGR